MKHLGHDTLWALAQGTASGDERASAEAHLLGCARCTAALDDVRAAQGVLSALPEVPPMPEGLARRVGARLAQTPEPQSWLERLWPRRGPALAFAAALVVLLGVALWRGARSDAPAPQVADFTVPKAPPPLEPPAVVMPPPPAPPLPAKARVARVTRAQRGAANGLALSAADTLVEGRELTTEAGGGVALALHDGTSAQLAASSSLRLARLEDAVLTLALEHGSVALDVPHRPSRLLTVEAGDLVVKDLGTRFSVSRDRERVVVTVDEGEVELSAPKAKEVVTAGKVATYERGALHVAKRPVAPHASPGAEQPARGEPTDGAVAKLTPDEADAAERPAPTPATAPTPSAEPTRDADEDWTVPSSLAAKPPPAHRGASSFGFEGLEQQLITAREQVAVRDGMTPRQARARSVAELGDQGRCEAVLADADAFLKAPPAEPKIERAARRLVLLTKQRCLLKLGRAPEAADVARALEALR